MTNPLHWMQTYTGRAFRYDAPENLEIDIKDIAVPLSRMPRFCGSTSHFLSVAEHSIVVMKMAAAQGANPLVQLHALMHDAHEAFTGDMIAPFKRFLESKGIDISGMQAIFQFNILAALDIPCLDSIPHADLIHTCDMQALKVERDRLMKSQLDWGQIDGLDYDHKWLGFYNNLSPREAANQFHFEYSILRDLVRANG